jgi:hypothetical protein
LEVSLQVRGRAVKVVPIKQEPLVELTAVAVPTTLQPIARHHIPVRQIWDLTAVQHQPSVAVAALVPDKMGLAAPLECRVAVEMA